MLDSIGTEISRHFYGEGGYQSANSIVQLENGDFIFSGIWHGYGCAMRIDPEGEQVWLHIFEEYDSGILRDLDIVGENRLLLSGVSNANGGDAWLLMIDEEGEVVWSRTYGGEGSQSSRRQP